MARPKGAKTVYFSKVLEARKAIAEKAMEMFELNLKLVRDAMMNADYKAAGEHLRWLQEHTSDEEGNRMIDVSVDKPKDTKGIVGPTIQIGIALGPAPVQKELPPAEAEVIDVTPIGSSTGVRSLTDN